MHMSTYEHVRELMIISAVQLYMYWLCTAGGDKGPPRRCLDCCLPWNSAVGAHWQSWGQYWAGPNTVLLLTSDTVAALPMSVDPLLPSLLVDGTCFPIAILELAQMASVIRCGASRCALTLLSHVLVCGSLAVVCGHLSVEAISVTTATTLLVHCIVPFVTSYPPVPARLPLLLLGLRLQLLLSGFPCDLRLMS